MADNSSRKFKFISPGVFINEIDNSQVPQTPGDIGPVVIGLATKGPMMTPVTVNSLDDAPELMNSSPYGDGWIVKMKLDDASGVSSLMDASGYRAEIGE